MDFPGKSPGVGCHLLLQVKSAEAPADGGVGDWHTAVANSSSFLRLERSHLNLTLHSQRTALELILIS